MKNLIKFELLKSGDIVCDITGTIGMCDCVRKKLIMKLKDAIKIEQSNLKTKN